MPLYKNIELANLTDSAKTIINNKFNGFNIAFAKELVIPDGCDEYGPIMEVWDLYLYVVKLGKIYKHHFNYTYQYKGNRTYKEVPYTLVDENIIKKLKD